MKKRILLPIVLVLVTVMPALAVFSEKNLGQTLSVLRYELRQEYQKITHSRERIDQRKNSQHNQMVHMLRNSNELSLILYSQNQDYTFDMTYALKKATREYEEFNEQKMPFDEIINRMDIEIDRYSRLVESLRRLPPVIDSIPGLPDSLAYHNDSVELRIHGMRRHRPIALEADEIPPVIERPFNLDSIGRVDRDSCIFYAKAMLLMYANTKNNIIEDSRHYEEVSARLKESYDYAQNRYKYLQKKIFIQGQDNYFKVLGGFSNYCRRAFGDAKAKYAGNLVLDDDGALSHSEWRGPMVFGFIGLVLVYLLVATLLSIVTVSLLRRFSASMRTEEFRKHIPCLTMFCGSAIFALTLMVVSNIMDNHFYQLASQLLLVFAWLIAAILLSLLIRLNGQQIGFGMKIYTPVIVIGLIIIIFRILFIPNNLINLILTPLLLVFFFWQLRLCRKAKDRIPQSDLIISWITLVVLGINALIACAGYVLLSVQLLIWWLFQLSVIESIFAIFALLSAYEEKRLKTKVNAYKAARLVRTARSGRGDYIRVTWFFDMVKDALVPVMVLVSLPVCLWLAADVFDLTEVCENIFYTPWLHLSNADGMEILHVSLYKIILVGSLFFVFKYLAYLLKALYHDMKLHSVHKENGSDYIHTNQINFTLANNIIGIVIWGIYLITAILLLRIPMGAISIIAAGLATGIGLALKDVLNNFIYGIQLMSGRLRVGDYLECDGIRGKVTAISYQSTQIETSDGAVMSFLNTALFNKNFKNLTRNNSYELVTIEVGIGYGSDIQKVRQLLLDALRELHTQDQFGRDIVDVKRGISVAFNNFGESSIDLAVKQYVLVSERVAFLAQAKEIIYNTLNENNIEIPFPQRDVNLTVLSKPE